MQTGNKKIFLLVGLTIAMAFGQSACAASTPVPPIPTVIVNTPTPEFTSTPKATFTATATPTATVTFTPAVTATQLPEITPAADGTGNVVGLVLWDSQPVTQSTVRLCETWYSYSGCGGTKYIAQTDENGYFVFSNVVPGQYQVVTTVENTNIILLYVNKQQSNQQQVIAGKNLVLDPWNTWKLDLHPVFPKNGQTVSDVPPTFKWDPYPDAAYYKISVGKENNDSTTDWILENERVDGTEFTPKDSLMNCTYDWDVQAFNIQGTIISEFAPPTFSGTIFYQHFKITNGEGTC